MTLQEAKRIVSISSTFDLDYQESEYFDQVFKPMRQAVASGNEVVINYLKGLSMEELTDVYTAIAWGAKYGKHPDAIQLYVKMCDAKGYKVNTEITASLN